MGRIETNERDPLYSFQFASFVGPSALELLTPNRPPLFVPFVPFCGHPPLLHLDGPDFRGSDAGTDFAIRDDPMATPFDERNGRAGERDFAAARPAIGRGIVHEDVARESRV